MTSRDFKEEDFVKAMGFLDEAVGISIETQAQTGMYNNKHISEVRWGQIVTHVECRSHGKFHHMFEVDPDIVSYRWNSAIRH